MNDKCGACGSENVPLVFLAEGWEGVSPEEGLCRECARRVMPLPQVLSGGHWANEGKNLHYVSDSDSSTAGEKSASGT